ncbi:hypothetical protein SAMN05444392_10523 [Seinonella peptonophila]|uniref:Uncharacterized protein n=1 Tax=Seinonella peptonophila TaxID=112248 RepID=A0A1M4XI35_9BACL|nr:hypothetical protein [Seinonella peptonophila]SHE93337.1 hypothetical protein SAMN05444392_10523 [Seinonella peptonophila]
MRKEQDITLATLLEAMQNLNAKIDRMENRLVEQVVEVKEDVTTVKEEIAQLKQHKDQYSVKEILFRQPAES